MEKRIKLFKQAFVRYLKEYEPKNYRKWMNSIGSKEKFDEIAKYCIEKRYCITPYTYKGYSFNTPYGLSASQKGFSSCSIDSYNGIAGERCSLNFLNVIDKYYGGIEKVYLIPKKE